MGIVIKQSAISTGITYIGVAIGYVNLLILFPKYMTPDEVGLVRIIQDFAILMVPFAQIGVGQITVRYFPEYRNKSSYGEFVSSVFTLLLIALIIYSLAFFLLKGQLVAYFSPHSPEVISYLSTILVLIIIMSVNQLLVAFSNSSLNIVLPNFLKEIWLRLVTAVLLILFAASYISFNQFINLLVIAYIFNLSVLAIYLFNTGTLRFSLNRVILPAEVAKPMLKFGLITFLGASGFLIIGKVDSIMVSGMIGLTENAIYTTAFYIAVLIELPRRAISQIGMPIISRAFESNNSVEIESIYKKSALNNLIIGLILFIGIWINLDNVYTLIPKSEVYSLGSSLVIVLGFGKLIDMASGLNGEIIVMSKYYKVNVYLILLLSVVTIAANYLLIPIIGLKGAALGSTLAIVLFNFCKYLFLLLKMKIQPFSVNTLKVILIGLLILTIGIYLPKLDNVYFDIIYRSVIVSLIYVVTILSLKISPDINEQVNKIIGRQK